ncbi:hypothetical protein CBL_20092 [Carabus blaptoides fortunei]
MEQRQYPIPLKKDKKERSSTKIGTNGQASTSLNKTTSHDITNHKKTQISSVKELWRTKWDTTKAETYKELLQEPNEFVNSVSTDEQYDLLKEAIDTTSKK